jgi:hypothetical protein
MKRILVLSLLLIPAKALAVPVIPNFSSGSTTATTTSKSTTVESIQSYTYSTGYEFTQSGNNIVPSGSLTPATVTVNTQTINGVRSSNVGIDFATKPTYNQQTPGIATQYIETYKGPGLQSVTLLDRTQNIESVTTSVSVFSQ